MHKTIHYNMGHIGEMLACECYMGANLSFFILVIGIKAFPIMDEPKIRYYVLKMLLEDIGFGQGPKLPNMVYK